MLRNEKLLKNGNKLLKGTHLEAYLSVNAGLTRTYVQYGVSGATADDPLYTLLYDSQGYTFTESISDYSNLQVSYYNTNTSLTKYFLTYGNTDALTSITSTTTGVLGGDLKGFINHHTNLNKVNIGNTNMSVNLNNFTWPKGMDYINFSLTPNITGAWDTMSNIDQVTHLSISRGGTLTGAIRDFKNLTYLSYDGWEANDLLVDDASLWTFVPNLSYFYIRYEDNITGNISGWTFSENLENIRFDAMDGVEGDISNWDFSNCGNFGQFIISLNANITGDISGWRFPDDTGDGITVQMRYLGITNIGMDLSNTKFKSFIISSMPSVTSDFSDLIFPDTTTSISISYLDNMGGDIADVYIPDSMLSYAMVSNSLTGDIISLDIPTGITSFYFNNSNVSGNISGLTLWDGLETFSLIDCDNITGTISGVNTTIPTSLDGTFSLSNLNNITLDLTSTFDFKNATTITFTSISGVTGNFSNMIISGCTSLYMNNINNTVPDYGDLSINWDIIEIINIQQNEKNVSDFTDWFPSGSTCHVRQVYISGSNTERDYTGDITNWYLGNFDTSTYTTLNLQFTTLYGDIGNWSSPMPRYTYIDHTNISGDVGQLDFISTQTEYIQINDTNISGNLSGVTLDYRVRSFFTQNNTGMTGIEDFIDYIWVARKNWLNSFSINTSNIGDSPSGVYEQGDIGTFSGHPWDLTAAEINFLVQGLDYTGSGSNTPWTPLQKIYYLISAMVSEFSTTKKYKISQWTY